MKESALDQYARIKTRLQHAYDTGRLVPFLGSGVCFPACRLWTPFVTELERQAGVVASDPEQHDQGKPAAPPPEEIVRRANKAIQQLRLAKNFGERAAAIREALWVTREVTPALHELNETFWPLTLTTNYDDLHCQAFEDRHHRTLRILGRSQVDCHAILDALHSPSEPMLWCLQGFLGQDAASAKALLSDDREQQLASEVVVGHEEYRRVTYSSPHFRRSFAEVFRSRSLLFLGFGLQDPYIMELFSEILETFGPNPFPHYAFVPRAEVDAAFLAQRFNIIAVLYDDHGEVPNLLHQLNVDLVTQRTKTNSWGFSLRAGSNPLGWEDGESDLRIVAGALPPPGRDQCAVVSVGREGSRFTFGSQISILQMFENAGYLTGGWEGEPTLPVNSMVHRLGQYHVFFVEVRDEQGGQDLRMISKATGAVLDAAAAAGFDVVYAPLLAAGPARITAASFLLTEMLRGFARWRKRNQTTNISLMIYVVDPEVLNCLRSGRLDPAEILSCDDLRFWLEIEDREGAVERIPYHMPAETKIKTLMRTACNLSCDKWTFGIRPAPRKDKPFLQSSEIRDTDSLEDVGVVPGCTVRFSFSRRTAAKAVASV